MILFLPFSILLIFVSHNFVVQKLQPKYISFNFNACTKSKYDIYCIHNE